MKIYVFLVYNIFKEKIMDNNKHMHTEELKKISGGYYTGPHRFEIGQKVRVKRDKRIGKISNYDLDLGVDAYVVWFASTDYPNNWGNQHYLADDLETI